MKRAFGAVHIQQSLFLKSEDRRRTSYPIGPVLALPFLYSRRSWQFLSAGLLALALIGHEHSAIYLPTLIVQW